MKKVLCIILCMVLVCGLFASCSVEEKSLVSDKSSTAELSNSELSTPTVTEKNYEDGTYTLMIYMCGSDLETKSGAATKNIAEMLSAKISEKTKVIIQTGGAKKWRNYGISPQYSSRYELRNGELVLIEQTPPVNMGQSSSLESFLLWADENYPAEHRGVIFWDHGGGSIKGVCCDEQYSFDALSLTEIETALKSSFENCARKYDFIGFDACLMANYETACAVEPFAEKMIASEESEPSGGWNYTAVAESVLTDEFYDKVLSSYAEKCEAKNKKTYTLSVIDLEKFSDVKSAVNDFVDEIGEKPLNSVARSAGKALCFGTNQRDVFTDLIDLSGFALAAENNAVCEAVANCVKSVSGEYRKDAKGLSVYYPLNSVKSVQDYLVISDDENYKAFLTKNYSDTSDGEIFIINGGSDDNGKLKVQINTDTVKNVIKTSYRLYRIVSIGENHEVVYGMGEDTDVFFDGANGYTAEFEGFWVTFNGYYINYSVETDSEQYTEFSSPAKINGVLSEICFVYDKEKKQMKLQGYCTVDAETNVVGRLTDFSVGDKITLLYDDRTEYEKNLIEGDSFTFSDSTDLSIEKLPEGYYQYNMYFYNAFGNTYRSDTAVIYFDGEKSEIIEISPDETTYN